MKIYKLSHITNQICHKSPETYKVILMKSQNSTFQLKESQFEQAVDILHKEQQANMPSKREKVAFTVLNVVAYALGLATPLLVIIFLIISLNLPDSTGIFRTIAKVLSVILTFVFVL